MSLLRGVILAAAAQFAVFHAPTIQAASITISNDACESFTLSGSAGNHTLVCVPGSSSSVPVCTVTGAANAVIGGTVNLVASCSGSPTSWVWTGGNCGSSTGSTCPATENSPGSVAYTVTAANANGPGGTSPAKSVNWTTTAVPSCTLSASPSTVPAAGANVTLTATCTNSPTSWTWTGGFAGPSTAVNSQVVSTTPGTTFTVAGTNTGGTGSPASVTVGLASGGSTGNVAISSCPGYTSAQTKVMDVTIPDNGAGFTKYYVTTSGIFRDGKSTGFGANDVIVVVFKAPPVDPAWGLSLTQTGDSVNGSSSMRTMVLSRKPCDFDYPKSADAIWATESSNMGLTLASGTTPSAYSRYLLVPGEEYYFNIRNKTSNGGGCASTRCDIIFATSNNKP